MYMFLYAIYIIGEAWIVLDMREQYLIKVY
jgi:hypothetical protein